MISSTAEIRVSNVDVQRDVPVLAHALTQLW